MTSSSHSASSPHTSKRPWYKSFWWLIWLTIIAAVALYAAGSSLFFHHVIEPAIQAERQAMEEEQEAYLKAFREFIQSQTAQYHQELHEWRENTPINTPPPRFNYHEKAQQYRKQQEQQGAHQPAEPSDDKSLINPFIWFSLMALIIGGATYPVVRRITRRLEKLQQGVENFGTGNLHSRVEVSGHDEVAHLAESFNASAAKIESLLLQHKDLLAHVSHELRTPLARLRMSTELITPQSPEIAEDLRTDIHELDQLVDEILLASRLDAQADFFHPSSFDAFALAAEEAARTHAELHGHSIEIYADEVLLRRALRNLLTNAQRYAANAETTITVSLEASQGNTPAMVCFTVADQGPGLSAAEMEQVFTPFFRSEKGKSVSGGIGLGLPLVKQIALRHQGSIICKAQPEGSGCIFELRIPLHT